MGESEGESEREWGEWVVSGGEWEGESEWGGVSESGESEWVGE